MCGDYILVNPTDDSNLVSDHQIELSEPQKQLHQIPNLHHVRQQH